MHEGPSNYIIVGRYVLTPDVLDEMAALRAGSGGELEIVTHPSGSLFKGDEIFRAVRTGQAPIGERLISALGNDDPLFEIDALPFLATSFDDAARLYKASKPTLEKVLGEKGLVLLYAVPWPPQGLYNKTPVNSAADMKGVKFRAYNTATERLCTFDVAASVSAPAEWFAPPC